MDREEEHLQHLAALGRWVGRREQGVDEDPPKGPDGVLDPGLLKLAFKTLRRQVTIRCASPMPQSS